jgi:hypothetical protein
MVLLVSTTGLLYELSRSWRSRIARGKDFDQEE